jgi:site-specific recombinase XerD
LNRDIHGNEKQYVRCLAKIRDEFDSNDSALLLRFLRLKELEGMSVARRLKYYAALKVFRRVCDPITSVSREHVEEFLLLLRNEYRISSQETDWYCAKKFFEFVGKGELFDGLRPSFSARGMKLPEELLSREEIDLLIKNARSLRDRALISVMYESGARIGELITLQLKHVSFDEYGAVLIVDGKTGMRRIRLIETALMLKDYVYSLPKGSEGPLWPNGKGSNISYAAVYRMLGKLVRSCGLDKQVYPHLFRHSRATHLADKLTEAQMKILFGWAGNSDVPSVYVHLSGRDVEEALLRIYGINQRGELGMSGLP